MNDSDECGGLNPLIRMQAGKKYQLRLENQAAQPTNIHTHGLHIPGDGNTDDVSQHRQKHTLDIFFDRVLSSNGFLLQITRVAPSGSCLFYNWTIPEDHMDGTFWYHAHVHELTEDQVNGGALGVLLIDPAESADLSDRPDWVHEQRLLLLTTQQNGRVQRANGEASTTIRVEANVWTRLRVIVADPRGRNRDLFFESEFCEVHAAAHDGVWRNRVPSSEEASLYRVTGASRIDLVIRCSQNANMYYNSGIIDPLNLPASPMVSFDVSGSTTNAVPTPLEFWNPVRPSYLQSLMNEDIPNDTFDVQLGPDNINGVAFDPTTPLETFTHGTTQQWRLRGTQGHPFHLHLYHMQIVQPGGCGGMYAEGEWFDVISAEIQGSCRVRFPMDDIAGKMMFHCHILAHEDDGTMGWAQIVGGPPHGTDHVASQVCDSECYAP